MLLEDILIPDATLIVLFFTGAGLPRRWPDIMRGCFHHFYRRLCFSKESSFFADCFANFPTVLSIFQIAAFVVQFFTAGEADLDFGPAFFEVEL